MHRSLLGSRSNAPLAGAVPPPVFPHDHAEGWLASAARVDIDPPGVHLTRPGVRRLARRMQESPAMPSRGSSTEKVTRHDVERAWTAQPQSEILRRKAGQ